MAVRWYIIGLLLSCTVGGLTVQGIVAEAGLQVELKQQNVTDSVMSAGDVSRLEDSFAQWMLLGDLVIGSGQAYFAADAKELGERLLEILNQLEASLSTGSNNPFIIEIEAFIASQQDRLDHASLLDVSGDERQLALNALLVEVDNEASPAIEAIEALRSDVNKVLADDKHALELADSTRDRWAIAAAAAFITWIGCLWVGATHVISRPLRWLRDEAGSARAENRRLETRRVGPTEVRDLSASFGELVGHLEDAVAERTEHLDQRNVELAESRDEAFVALNRERLAMGRLEQALAKVEEAASTDKLTGLPNRSVFVDRLDQIIRQARRDNTRFAVLFFDFDRFKVVNDSLGHDVGDALLCDIADIFRRELRESDTVARFGGDEFIVLLTNLASWEDAKQKAQILLEAFAAPHHLEDHLVVSTASIGLVTNKRKYNSAADMIRDADAAMYHAKEAGKARVAVFDSRMHAKALDRLVLEAALRHAIEREELRLVYQPIVDMDSAVLTGFEALIRWDHPVRGIISPVDFIPIAEDTGLIVDIGSWVLNTAAAQIADWNQRFDADGALSMNINLSKRQLLDPMFLQNALKCLQDHNLRSRELKLEITESTISDERHDVVPLLRELRDYGFPIVMDDFGTGMSSLASLHQFPIDVLKIDQAFIRVLDRDRSLLAVVASITTLAENLGIKTVAEGVETIDIVGALQSIGCTWGQGYYFAKPLSVSDAEAFIIDQQQCNPRAA